MANFTFKELQFTNDSNDEFNMNGMCPIRVQEAAPRKSTINNILGYSRALSVRKSSHLENIKMIVN